MTTNHRPTLESKKGKKRPIGDSVVHARGLSQQTELKYRSDAPFYNVNGDEVKRFNGEVNAQTKRLKTERDEESSGSVNTKYESRDPDEVDDNTIKEDASVDDNDPATSNSEAFDDDSDSDSDSDSDEDSEALLAELANIKKEKEEQKKLQDQRLLDANPLLSTATKKSWRKSAFRSDKDNTTKDSKFTTNSVDSDYHQTFLSKFVR
ncbi:complexed with cef1p [Yamadazyma tenuis]|uniref:Pre-mRNA-splicing factor CWC15 n=1 Tax=Candida tenuis (strain ATCC 10573 / BCRC 21748 / CBS 615 / JCM 9827 / NBRC 10315 / NRRL Y-1498 / VKM Y-70) TaxID=590646 RepID=G3AXL3_CANTC|nr:uncharacterized protein CANTEDRAFT_91956 [Yamadazyma tenuis ATCC 10573]EGV65642.1 hypothetical protein CANTEDRAFT_91956 [Yamadazyma tenuis ATCC 10573]WEJ96049.1 complexed with cef1p [Yamadazyma tenuis]